MSPSPSIHLIPQHRKLERLQIARSKRGLACARSRAYPDNRVVFPDAVKEMKQTFAGKDACRMRGGEFWGQRGKLYASSTALVRLLSVATKVNLFCPASSHEINLFLHQCLKQRFMSRALKTIISFL
jgi:hypothetical protein